MPQPTTSYAKCLLRPSTKKGKIEGQSSKIAQPKTHGNRDTARFGNSKCYWKTQQKIISP